MGRGNEKLKAKLAGAFVTFRGAISLILVAWNILAENMTGTLVVINFLLGFATFIAGLGVLIGSRKGYFAATFLTSVHLIFLGGSIFGILLDLAVLGALWKGWKIQIDESFDPSESLGRNY